VLNLAKNNLSGEFPVLSMFPLLTVLDLTSNDLLTGILSLPQEDVKVDVTEDASDSPGLSPASIAAISCTLVVVLTLIGGIIAYFCYFEDIIKARKRQRRHDEPSELQSKITGHVNIPGSSSVVKTSDVEINMDDMGMKSLRITKKICKGGFGIVYEGVYEGRDVAIKRILVPQNKRDKIRLAVMFSKHF
jgi:hypothetical protein